MPDWDTNPNYTLDGATRDAKQMISRAVVHICLERLEKQSWNKTVIRDSLNGISGVFLAALDEIWRVEFAKRGLTASAPAGA